MSMDNVLVTFLVLALKGLLAVVLYMMMLWYAKGAWAQLTGRAFPESLETWSGHAVAIGCLVLITWVIFL